jgi:hypothetical protein
MEAMLGISLCSFVFLIIAYVFSSTKLEIRAEQGCLEMRGLGGKLEGAGGGGRNGPNNICTCE